MKIKCIINGNSGRGNNPEIPQFLKNKFSAHDLDIVITVSPAHASEAARESLLDGTETIIVAGGDGTINEIINAVAPSDIPIGIIPVGTANDLAGCLKLPDSISEACDIILRRNIRPVDLICVNGWYFLTAGGFGLPARAISAASTLRKKLRAAALSASFLGSGIYILGLLWAFITGIKKSALIRFSSPHFTYSGDVHSLVLSNQPMLGQRFKVCPGADNSDGIMDLFMIENDGSLRRYLSSVLRTFSGSQAKMSNVGMYRADRLCINTDRLITFFGDGNIGLTGKWFDVNVVPRAVNLLAP